MIRNLTLTFLRYLTIWKLMTLNSFQVSLVSRFGAILFLVGKTLRMIFFLIFLVILVNQTKLLSGYTVSQTVFFFLTFNVLDTLSQLLFREVYRFRPLVVSGNFDLILTKPMSPLFRVLAGGADILDLFMIVPYILALVVVAMRLGPFAVTNVILFILLLANGFVIALAFHIFVASLGVLTTEIDHTIMIYRDIVSMGRVPIDIYREPLRGFLTFVIPVGIMMTFPVKAFLGLLNIPGIILSLVFGAAFVFLSLKLWNFALSKYTSASS